MCCLCTKVAQVCPWLIGISVLTHLGQRQHLTKDCGHVVGFSFFKRWQFQDSCFLGHSSSLCVTSVLWREATQLLSKSILNTMEIFLHRKKLSRVQVCLLPHTARCGDCLLVFPGFTYTSRFSFLKSICLVPLALFYSLAGRGSGSEQTGFY